MSKEDHLEYIKKKEDKTIKLYEDQMIKGKIFNENHFADIDKKKGTIKDFEEEKEIENINE